MAQVRADAPGDGGEPNEPEDGEARPRADHGPPDDARRAGGTGTPWAMPWRRWV